MLKARLVYRDQRIDTLQLEEAFTHGLDVRPDSLPSDVPGPKTRRRPHDLEDFAGAARFEELPAPCQNLFDAHEELVLRVCAFSEEVQELVHHCLDDTEIRSRDRRRLHVGQVVLDQIPVALQPQRQGFHRRPAPAIRPGADPYAGIQQHPQRLGQRIVGEQLGSHCAPPPAHPHRRGNLVKNLDHRRQPSLHGMFGEDPARERVQGPDGGGIEVSHLVRVGVGELSPQAVAQFRSSCFAEGHGGAVADRDTLVHQLTHTIDEDLRLARPSPGIDHHVEVRAMHRELTRLGVHQNGHEITPRYALSRSSSSNCSNHSLSYLSFPSSA